MRWRSNVRRWFSCNIRRDLVVANRILAMESVVDVSAFVGSEVGD